MAKNSQSSKIINKNNAPETLPDGKLHNAALFLKTFGYGYKRKLSILMVGNFIQSMLELIGIALIFPLISMLHNKNDITSSRFVKPIFDALGFTKQEHFILFIGACVVSIYIFKNVFQILLLRYEFKILAAWKNDIACRFFSAYMSSPYLYHMQRKSADFVTMLTHTIFQVINNAIYQYLTLIALAFTGMVLIMVLLIYYFWVMVFSIMLFAGLFFLQSLLIKYRTLKIAQNLRIKTAQNFSVLQQSFRGYKDTKLNLKEHFFLNKFKLTNFKTADAEETLQFYRQIPNAVTEIVVFVTLFFAFGYLVLTQADGDSLVLNASILIIIIFRMIPLVNRSMNCIAFINNAREPLHNLLTTAKEVGVSTRPVDNQDPVDVKPLKLEKGLALKDVSFTYPDQSAPAIHSIDLNIPKGSFIGITGPSGGGKSTLIAILLGFLSPDKGQYTIDEKTISKGKLDRLKRSIGYVDQEIFLIEGNIAQNVAFGEDEDKIDVARVEDSLKKAQLWDHVETLPNGIFNTIGEAGKFLSGGQKQRMAIARAFYKQPGILILDEASAALDVKTEEEITKLLLEQKGKMTIIAIAHRLSTLRHCDKILFIEEGKISHQGDFQHLIDTSPVFEEMVRLSKFNDDKTAKD